MQWMRWSMSLTLTRFVEIVLLLTIGLLALHPARLYAQCSFPLTVSDEAELNAAIDCYNMQYANHADRVCDYSGHGLHAHRL
jgi:hypothetical protein